MRHIHSTPACKLSNVTALAMAHMGAGIIYRIARRCCSVMSPNRGKSGVSHVGTSKTESGANRSVGTPLTNGTRPGLRDGQLGAVRG